MNRNEELISTLRVNLGGVRSCALMMAHAQSSQVRTQYLKGITERLAVVDDLLARLESSPDSARASTE